MMTRWGQTLAENDVLQEYPRPQFRRASYLNLNGHWRYAMTPTDEPPTAWDGEILVPFSPECALSGVNRCLQPGQTLWYQRALALPDDFADGRVLLHFGAVDQDAVVFLNGREVARHEGGYNAFTAELPDALMPGENMLTVRVRDDTDASWRTRGKQKQKRGGIWYTPQSGIWQTVWAERVPKQYMRGLRLTPRLNENAIEICVIAEDHSPCEAVVEGKTYPLTANQPTLVPIAAPRLWSPEDPFLYSLTVRMGEDEAESYFAMRSTAIVADAKGVRRLYLNGKPYFHNGLLDQGYWPDGLYTAPSDEALLYDIQTAKALGFNMLRKHIKVEPMRWYYHCDRLGMLVWQDMPNGGGAYRFSTITLPLITGRHHSDRDYARFAREAAEGRDAYRRELDEMVAQLYNCPCIVLWVPFNEGWGQFDAADAVRRLNLADGTRPADPASGWHDQRCGDLRTWHVYFKKYRFHRDRLGRAVALSEFGGYNLRIAGHSWNDVDFGYKKLKSGQELQAAYETLYDTQVLPAIHKGLCATVYTQLTDVEDELNGLITYDREVLKLPPDALRALNRAIAQAGEANPRG
ncbi:MAG TPA: glycoside hydrolase family 2 TIM barrel-domain containing protein [Candidatus Limiplasma sp.]|nr:glycoside hydrolase family 2 TIM barrel-domain containing protein [Candidatus Limiplasma sp.]HPS81373.1 glycoside hydrolase family 2 TIM barrel-domain containing protein [Candidatus Limiplasma sp.]